MIRDTQEYKDRCAMGYSNDDKRKLNPAQSVAFAQWLMDNPDFIQNQNEVAQVNLYLKDGKIELSSKW